MADILGRLLDQVQSAIDERQAIRIEGGNSKAFLGRSTDPDAQVIRVKEHSGILSYQPVELVMTVRAGTTLNEIEAALDEKNQMMAFEPPRFGDRDTIGGTLACNLSGPGRPWWGSVRDHLLGVRLINGRAEHLRFGGQVMKNVAGYDLSRLQAGAMGGLGLLTELSFKVLPKPALTITLAQECDEAEAIRLMNERSAKAKPISAAIWMEGQLYTRLAGAESAVLATEKAWGGVRVENCAEFWKQIRDQKVALFSASEPLWRLSVRSSAPPLFPGKTTLIDWGGAQRWYPGEADVSSMQAAATQAGGQAMLFRGGDRQSEVNHPVPESIQAVQKRIKRSMDPKGLFNPGRVYGWL